MTEEQFDECFWSAWAAVAGLYGIALEILAVPLVFP